MSKLYRYSLFGALILMQAFMCNNASADKLSHLRTSKKIVPVKSVSAPYFAIQILALKEPPQAPSYFKNIEFACEFECSDGFVRYTVGNYSSAEDAREDIARIKSLGYSECFVVDLRNYTLDGAKSSGEKFYVDKNTTYTIQLAAFRYPVYINYFEEFDNVMEFYPDDRIYRYTVGEYKGTEASDQLDKVKAMGYPHAYLVPLDKYLPYQIE
jgi:hypothetical protein